MMYLILYLIAGAASIFAENEGYQLLMYVSKVLLMPLLALYYHFYLKGAKASKFIYLALFFSWLGDIFLMFPRDESSPNAKLLFICGLVSFLIGHINYIIHFVAEVKVNFKRTILITAPYLILPFILYIVVLLKLLYPTLGEMKMPVTIYAIVITSMLISAFNRKNFTNKVSYYFVLFGASLFVISDSCIAINLFYKPFDFARMSIMITYILAQLIIIKGVLESKSN
jgi:uncharacterized membrane protein YhhN